MNHAHWREERTFFEGDEYFEDVLQAIDSSKTDVILETYIFNPDEIGRRFEDSLIRASQRGVKIRLLVDGIGGSAWIPVRNPKLKSTGIETRVYHPIIFANLFSRLLIDLGILKSVRRRRSAFFSRINRRDHRKFICVDGNKAWVGSLNISAVHSKSVSGAKSWADTGLFVTGEHVRELIGSFENVWRRSHDIESGKRNWRESVFRNPATIGSQHLVRLNSTTKLRRRSFKDFVKRISKSRSRIWITNAYLAPSAPVSLALCKAAQRGVDVRLLVPRQSDVFFMPLVTRSHYEILLADRVKIY
jgi:cardiolipin synthase